MHGVILAGFLLLGLSTLAFQAHLLTPLVWMILTGGGLYMAYTPFNAMLFDRMIAFSGKIGTAGFLIYVADASGYLGSVALLVWRNFAMVDLDWLGFFIASAYATSVVGAVCTILAGVYFLRRRSITDAPALAAVVAQDAPAWRHAPLTTEFQSWTWLSDIDAACH
jgi:hypothetical protein